MDSRSSEPERRPMVIETRGLGKTFGHQVALADVDLDIPPGTIVGVIGPSGCGKTTLVRLLTGITTPSEGEVRVFGHRPGDFDARDRRRFGYMPQHPVLFPNLSVWGNLSFVASVYGMPLRRRRASLVRLLELVDLVEHRHKKLGDCSGGMQRRLSLAATLVHDPELLYLDEPTAGVDPILRERFWEHFRTLRDHGHTIVVPTQYVGEAVSCDVVAVMAAGRLLTVQPPDRLAEYAYGGAPVAVEFDDAWLAPARLAELRSLPFVRAVDRSDTGLVVVVDDAAQDVARLEQFLRDGAVPVESVVPLEPGFDEIFVRIMERHAPSPALDAA